MREEKEEGVYITKRVTKLPKRGNANYKYIIKGEEFDRFYLWLNGKYEEVSNNNGVPVSNPIITTSLTITPSELYALNTNDIELIPAPGEGKAIQLMSIAYYLDYNSTPYTTGYRVDLYLGDTVISLGELSTEIIRATSKKYVFSGGFRTPNNTVIDLNKALKFTKGALYNIANGDSNIIVEMSYKILDFN